MFHASRPMKIAYHFTIPKPPEPSLDAAIQDALKLQQHFPGPLNYLYPVAKATSLVPRFLCGLHQLFYLWQIDQQVEIHHVYTNELYPYPILFGWRKPIVMTVVASLKHGRRPWFARSLSPVTRFVTSNLPDQQRLEAWQLGTTVCIPPGIDLSRFEPTPPPSDLSFTLLAGSAPWHESQFASKGVDLLLQAAQKLPSLRLIFLWRGVLYEAMRQRVNQAGLSDRVEIINQQVEVHQLLKRVHASIVLAKTPSLIKAYPHSLLESLAAGRPILISMGLAMADYTVQNGCGLIVPDFELDTLLDRLTRLQQNYQAYQKQTQTVDLQAFSVDNLVNAYSALYEDVKHETNYEL
ncbi:glycosyltransferase [Anaerolineales bacterium HSG24]|nr:glycosyltransferase [Anaerolineales bacterium HSG24]